MALITDRQQTMIPTPEIQTNDDQLDASLAETPPTHAKEPPIATTGADNVIETYSAITYNTVWTLYQRS